MTTNSLTLPFLPGPSARPESSATSSRSAWRWLRVPAFLSPVAAGEEQRSASARYAEKRLTRLARRGQGIRMGTPELPYEPLAEGAAPLAALRRFNGLAVTITTRSSEILEQLELLIELDQRHAVAVDILAASFEPGSVDLAERLRAVSALSAQGITTRLLLSDLTDQPLSASAASNIRRLYEAARDCRAFDVAAVACGGEAEELMRYLRLEMGFPRSAPGRG